MSDLVIITVQCIKNTLDRNKKAYMARCEVYSVNGKKGGRPKKPLVFEKAKKPDNDSDNDIDNDNDNDNDNVIDIDSDSDNICASASSVSDAPAPRTSEDDKKYFKKRGYRVSI